LLSGDLEPRSGGFRGRSSIDYVNDTQLKVNLDVLPSNRLAHLGTAFPKNVAPQKHGDESLYYILSNSRLQVLADLVKHRTTLAGGKPGVFWQASQPISTDVAKLWLRLTVYIQSRSHPKSTVTWEYDLLPFLSGGQFESKRSRHCCGDPRGFLRRVKGYTWSFRLGLVFSL
jgi:hypothetical protein